MAPLGTSLSNLHHPSSTGPYISSTSSMNLVSPQHIWWDESQLDLDLADDSVIGSSEKQPTQKQRFKKKLLATVKTTYQQHGSDHPRASWISTSSSRSSLYSTNSLHTPSFRGISHSKLSSPFIHLKHLFQKH